jgi:hypothetical protein
MNQSVMHRSFRLFCRGVLEKSQTEIRRRAVDVNNSISGEQRYPMCCASAHSSQPLQVLGRKPELRLELPIKFRTPPDAFSGVVLRPRASARMHSEPSVRKDASA